LRDPEKEVERSRASRAPTHNEYVELPASSEPHMSINYFLWICVTNSLLSVYRVEESAEKALNLFRAQFQRSGVRHSQVILLQSRINRIRPTSFFRLPNREESNRLRAVVKLKPIDQPLLYDIWLIPPKHDYNEVNYATLNTAHIKTDLHCAAHLRRVCSVVCWPVSV